MKRKLLAVVVLLGLMVAAGAVLALKAARSSRPAVAPPPIAKDLQGEDLPPFARARIGPKLDLRVAQAMAFSAEGTAVVSAHAGGLITTVDARTGEVVASVRFHDPGKQYLYIEPTGFMESLVRETDSLTGERYRPLSHVTISADGRRIAAILDGGVEVWDAQTGTSIRRWDEGVDPAWSVGLSPDGTRLAVGCREMITNRQFSLLLDVETGARGAEFDHSQPLSAVFSADGRKLAIHGNSLHIVDLAGRAPTIETPQRNHANWGVYLSGDGSKVATRENADTKSKARWVMRDAATAEELWSLPDAAWGRAAFSPDGRLFVVPDGGGTIHDAATGEVVKKLSIGGGRFVTALVFSPDGAQLAACAGGRLVVWSTETWETTCTPPPRSPPHGGVTNFAFAPDSRSVASVGGDGFAHLWNAADGSLLQRLPLDEPDAPAYLTAVAFSASGRLLAVRHRSKVVRVWDLESGTLQSLHGIPNDGIQSTAGFLGESAVTVRASADGSLTLQRLEDGREIVLAVPGSAPLRPVLVASGLVGARIGQSIRVWPVSDGGVGTAVTLSPANLVELSADGAYAATYTGMAVQVFDTATGAEELEVRLRHNNTDMPLAVSPDGRLLAFAGTSSIELWDVVSGTPLARLEGHHFAVRSLRFSPDGRTLGSTADGTILLWDMDPFLGVPGD